MTLGKIYTERMNEDFSLPRTLKASVGDCRAQIEVEFYNDDTPESMCIKLITGPKSKLGVFFTEEQMKALRDVLNEYIGDE